MTIFLFIVILAILILTHEFGHFIVAKLAKIRVDEFGLGLPPRIWGIKKGETLYSINWLPLGGFVKIFGEDPTEENISGPDSSRSLINRPKWIQILVLVAGVSLNLVLAWLLISTNLWLGMPVGLESLPAGLKVQDESLAIVGVLKDSPAELAGLKVGDRLRAFSVDGQRVDTLSSEIIRDFTKSFPGQEIKIDYQRLTANQDNQIESGGLEFEQAIVTPLPGLGADGQSSAIGIITQEIGFVSVYHWWQAPFYGLLFTYHLIVNTGLAFGHFFTTVFLSGREALNAIAGPIGIYSLVDDASRLGFVYLLNFTALISINLAILNLLPFPALDGGRLLFVVIEAIIRRPIKPIIANTLNTIGFGLLIFLMLIIAINDILRLL